MSSVKEQFAIKTINFYYENKMNEFEKEISSKLASSFLFGFVVGVLFTYMSLTPILIGLLLGIMLVKTNLGIINVFLMKVYNIINSLSFVAQNILINEKTNN